MTWKVRHEGSPTPVEVPTLEQLQEQLADGRWEPTDEVMGPNDKAWVAFENHPDLEAIAAELEPPAVKSYDDETRLDMTALIDVTLVLLVFFILTTTVSALQMRMEAPGVGKGKVGPAKVTQEQVASMILVKLKVENGEPTIRVEDQVVTMDRLIPALRRFAGERSVMLLQREDGVKHGFIVQVMDAAKAAGVQKINFVVP